MLVILENKYKIRVLKKEQTYSQLKYLDFF